MGTVPTTGRSSRHEDSPRLGQSPFLRLGFATEPVDSNDVFLFHKTTNRAVYECALASRPDCGDVLLWNERGEITETAYANVASPQLRAIWDAHQSDEATAELQAQINTAREIIDQFGLYPPSIKALLAEVYGFPRWPLRPPLDALTDEQTTALLTAIQPYLP